MTPTKKFNIHVVEDHDRALDVIYKEIGRKRIHFK